MPAEAMTLTPAALVVLFIVGGVGLLGEAAVLGVRRGSARSRQSLAVLVGGATVLFFVGSLLLPVGY